MNLFVAVIFVCVNEQCAFIYEPIPFNSQNECMKNLKSELDKVTSKYPAAMAKGSCIPINFKGA